MRNSIDFRMGVTLPIAFDVEEEIRNPFPVERVVPISVYTDWGKARMIDANAATMVLVPGGDIPMSITEALNGFNVTHVIIHGGGLDVGPITQVIDSVGTTSLALLESVDAKQIVELSGGNLNMAIYVNDQDCAADIAQALNGIENTSYIISDSVITFSLNTVIDETGAAIIVLRPESAETGTSTSIEISDGFILDVEQKLLRIGEFDPYILKDLDKWTAENGIPIELKLHIRQIEGENGVIGLVIEASDDVSAEIINMINNLPEGE